MCSCPPPERSGDIQQLLGPWCRPVLNELRLCVCEQLQPSTAAHKPTGKVVGIIKRNWRPFCGMLNVSQIKEVSCSIRPAPLACVQSRAASSHSGVCWVEALSFPLHFHLVNQAPFHPRRPPDPSGSYRNAPGFGPGRAEDHGGHGWLAQTFQIPKCELGAHRAWIPVVSRRRLTGMLVPCFRTSRATLCAV